MQMREATLVWVAPLYRPEGSKGQKPPWYECASCFLFLPILMRTCLCLGACHQMIYQLRGPRDP